MKNKLFLVLVAAFVFVTLVACATKDSTVKFDLNYEGAVGAPQQQVIEEEKATEPMAPTREGYEFVGWFKEKAGTTAYNFADVVKESMTLYAKWEVSEDDVVYYLAGSFSNYQADHPSYIMEKNTEGLYTITLILTDANRDVTYDGHYYKVTAGNWTDSYGVDNYYIDPAPQSPTGGGLGSVWHWANGTLTVTFDADELLITDTLVMSEDIIEEHNPSVYGLFNSWALEGENAVILSDDNEDGIYKGTFVVTEAGESDVTVAVSRKWYDDQWGQRWGAHEQYKLDGTVAGMGSTSSFTFEVGTYQFSFNSNTKVTTITKL